MTRLKIFLCTVIYTEKLKDNYQIEYIKGTNGNNQIGNHENNDITQHTKQTISKILFGNL